MPTLLHFNLNIIKKPEFKKDDLNQENGGGFTLIELLVGIGIIIVLSVIILANYRGGESQFALQRSAQKLTQDLRRAQEISMSAKSYNCGNGWKMKGYGINLTAGNDYYYLKARCENIANPRTHADRDVEKIYLEKEVKILSTNSQNIFFYPPDPQTVIEDLGGATSTSAVITLSLKKDDTKTKTIKVNQTGLIYVE